MAAPLVIALGRIALSNTSRAIASKITRARATGAAVKKMTEKDLKSEISHIRKNLRQRVSDIEKQGVGSAILEQASRAVNLTSKRALDKLGINDLRAVYSRMRDLESHKGTYKSTAQEWADTETKRQRSAERRKNRAERRRVLGEKASTQRGISSMSKDELLEYRELMLSSIKARRNRVIREVGDTHATRKFDEFLDQNDVKDESISISRLRYHASELRKISNYEGMTPSGARRQIRRLTAQFGPEFEQYTPEQQTAIIDEMRMNMAIHSIASAEALADVKAHIQRTTIDANGVERSVEHSFYRDNDGKMRVTFAPLGGGAEHEAHQQRRLAELRKYYDAHAFPRWS